VVRSSAASDVYKRQFLHGTTAGNRVTLTAGQCDISNPSYSDQDGIQMLNIPYVATPTTSGNDEVSLAFT
jgi:hypothetical protein